MIPKILHRVWVGDHQIPEDFSKYAETWNVTHSDWERILWTDFKDVTPSGWAIRDISEVFPLYNQMLYDGYKVTYHKYDLLRFEILYKYGGVYIDADFESLKNFGSLLDGIDNFTGIEFGTDPCWFQNELSCGIIGAEKGSQWIKAILDALQTCYEGDQPLIMYIMNRVTKELKTIKVFERDVFYPYGYGEPYRKSMDSYAIHRWGGSWRQI